MNTQKILFKSDCNGHEGLNPFFTLLEIDERYKLEYLHSLELKQIGVMRRGGNWQEIMKEGDIEFKG